MELFLDIQGYERYAVSTQGRVRNNLTGRILKPTLTSTGFYIVGLRRNGISKTMAIHKLVADRFINNPNNYKHLIHKDGNKANNEMYNLEWSDNTKPEDDYERKYKHLLKLVMKLSNVLNSHILELDAKDHHL
jgi:hypothetical protein